MRLSTTLNVAPTGLEDRCGRRATNIPPRRGWRFFFVSDFTDMSLLWSCQPPWCNLQHRFFSLIHFLIATHSRRNITVACMSNSYTQIYIHVVFAVEGRQNLIRSERNDELQKYISGIVSGQKQKLIAVNNMPDHVHLLIGLKPDVALSDLVRDIKAGSSKFINEKRWVQGRFAWQEGFGAFSYSRSQLDPVIRYIKNQQAHHAQKTFRQEYTELLKKFEIDYDERYILQGYDE